MINRRYSLDQIGLDICSKTNNKDNEQNAISAVVSDLSNSAAAAGGPISETTPQNSTNENDTSKTVEPVVKPTKRLSKVSDYIKIDYDDLEFYEKCGRGAYGTVFRGLWKSRSKIVAIKRLFQLENEAEILSSCSHRNIIQFYGVVTSESNYCIVTEYADYGSLHEFIRQHDLYEKFGLELILNWAHDIALGMNYLHAEAPMKIIHRDLKSNNVLITGNDLICKICDFGSSRFGLQTTRMTFTGTFPWMSPEIIQSKPANQSADVWSYGVVLWELITGEVPFKGVDEFQIAFLVVEKDYRLPIPNGCPPAMTTLMQLCWQTDPKLRPTFKQILANLDQIDVDDEAKAEIDNLMNKNRPKWETEIEQVFEKLKKMENDLHIKEKLLESREKRLREMEMELITNTNKLRFEDHDVNAWTEVEVYEWVKKLGQKNKGIGDYCEKFLNHNINGKRLLIMSKDDLRNIGIGSEGHIIELFHEMQTIKIENTRLLNFPPLRQPSQNKSQTQLKTSISYNLLIGTHLLETERPEDSKWKMYIDIDSEPLNTDSESKEINILSCIRDVKFVNKSTFEQYNLNKPPFLMKNWVKGYSNDTKIICTITYEDKVIQPRKTTVEYELNRKTPIAQQVVLTLEEEATELNNNVTCTSSNASSSNNSIISSNIQFQQMNNLMNNSPSFANLLGNNGQLSTENVWKKRNLENAVNIPQETQTKNSSDLWSGVVTGKYKINNTPLLKRPTNIYKPQTSQQASNDQHPPKLIRSQTLIENCSRRFSNSSNDSSSTSSSIGKKTTNSQYNGNNVHGTSNSYKHRPQLSSGSGGNKILRRKDNLSSIGRGKLAVIRGETNFDLEKNNKEVDANIGPSKTKKPIFY